MSKPTDGPWKAEPNYRGTGWYVNNPSTGQQLAAVNQVDAGLTFEESKAVAYAMAAAPELLEACEETLNCLKIMGVQDGGLGSRLSAAIAKAKGGAA